MDDAEADHPERLNGEIERRDVRPCRLRRVRAGSMTLETIEPLSHASACLSSQPDTADQPAKEFHSCTTRGHYPEIAAVTGHRTFAMR